MSPHLYLHPEVADALAEGRPVVALESTIIAHGMPYPRNIETALALETEVREAGAVPATIAILGGRLCAGLATDQLETIGQGGHNMAKVSRRDMAHIVAASADGATTVASTMIVAAMAGIRIFATGGIGGVHRGGASTMDISADLQELARTSVAVVCAGAKSILDLELTLEYLETYGVPVIGYQTNEFPAFYSRQSGLQLDIRLDTPEAVAHTLKVKWELGLEGGAVIANPIPEAYALPYEAAEAAIQQALEEAAQHQIKGKALTPFLLARIEQITVGDSLAANVQLARNNARLAGQISRHLV